MGPAVSCINPNRSYNRCRTTTKGQAKVNEKFKTREEWLSERQQYIAAIRELARADAALKRRHADRQEQAKDCCLASLKLLKFSLIQLQRKVKQAWQVGVKWSK